MDELQEQTREVNAFVSRCAPFAPNTERWLVSATSRLAWAVTDDKPWEFNQRELKELKSLIDTLLDELLTAQALLRIGPE